MMDFYDDQVSQIISPSAAARLYATVPILSGITAKV
jgi:hypothetical protein